MTFLIRPRDWWYSKLPLSVLVFLMLIGGRPLTYTSLVILCALIAIVSCVANYGYGVNELFDVEEDRRGGRSNVTETIGARAMWVIVALSASTALGLAAAMAGPKGFMLTCGVLLLPLGYSVPPLRVKERGWPGLFADALAAHVFPAVLALTLVSFQSLQSPSILLTLIMIVWSLSTGLRGIISHQLATEERDRNAGLSTIVHWVGRRKIERFVIFILLPIEVLFCAGIIWQSKVNVIFSIVVSIFLLYELLKFHLNIFKLKAFSKKGQPYIPFVDGAFYKVWGPLALLFDGLVVDLLYAPLIVLYMLAFRPRIFVEARRVRRTFEVVRTKVANAWYELRN